MNLGLFDAAVDYALRQTSEAAKVLRFAQWFGEDAEPDSNLAIWWEAFEHEIQS